MAKNVQNIGTTIIMTVVGILLAVYLLDPVAAAIAGVNASNFDASQLLLLGLIKTFMIIGIVYFAVKHLIAA
jgi:flagellar motor component MotA